MEHKKIVIAPGSDIVELGPQERPPTCRIYRVNTDFLDRTVIAFNNNQEDPQRRPLSECPDVSEKICSICVWRDADSGACRAQEVG